MITRTRPLKRQTLFVGTLTALVAAAATAAYTQGLPRSQEEFEKQVGITAAQKAKIQQIQAKYKPKFEALQKQAQALQTQFQNEAKPVAEQQQKEIEAVFTPAQKTKMKSIEAAVRAEQQKAAGGGGAFGGVPRPGAK